MSGFSHNISGTKASLGKKKKSRCYNINTKEIQQK